MTYQELSEKFATLLDSYYELMEAFERLNAQYGRVGTEMAKFAILLNKASREEEQQ